MDCDRPNENNFIGCHPANCNTIWCHMEIWWKVFCRFFFWLILITICFEIVIYVTSAGLPYVNHFKDKRRQNKLLNEMRSFLDFQECRTGLFWTKCFAFSANSNLWIQIMTAVTGGVCQRAFNASEKRLRKIMSNHENHVQENQKIIRTNQENLSPQKIIRKLDIEGAILNFLRARDMRRPSSFCFWSRRRLEST